jgi:hypothetical protein
MERWEKDNDEEEEAAADGGNDDEVNIEYGEDN